MFYKFYQGKTSQLIITGSLGNPYFQFISPQEEYEIERQCFWWRQEAGLEFKKQEEEIKEKKKKLMEKAAQIKSTAVEAKRVAASCIYM